jgi:regulatory protein
MLRAGHDYAHVKFILAASRVGDVEQWLDEAADQDKADGSW